jgi:hypothetical protein
MTNTIIVVLITGNSVGAEELGQRLKTDVTKAAMPEARGGWGGSEGD